MSVSVELRESTERKTEVKWPYAGGSKGKSIARWLPQLLLLWPEIQDRALTPAEEDPWCPRI